MKYKSRVRHLLMTAALGPFVLLPAVSTAAQPVVSSTVLSPPGVGRHVGDGLNLYGLRLTNN